MASRSKLAKVERAPFWGILRFIALLCSVLASHGLTGLVHVLAGFVKNSPAAVETQSVGVAVEKRHSQSEAASVLRAGSSLFFSPTNP
jgi:hypothetical protein